MSALKRTYQNATLSFDPEDRLTSISSPAFSATYDGDGLRASKTASGITTYFLYDGSNPVFEETSATTNDPKHPFGIIASLSAVNTFSVDGWRARYYPGGDLYAFAFDPQGSMLDKQSSSNTLTSVYSVAYYEAYGAKGAETDTSTAQKMISGTDPPAQRTPLGLTASRAATRTEKRAWY